METFWLLHVDLLLEFSVDKGMGDVHRAQVKVLKGSKSKNSSNGRHTHSRSKGLHVVEARPLVEALANKLNRSKEPSALNFLTKTQWQGIAFLPGGKDDGVQVLFCKWASISTWAVSFCIELGVDFTFRVGIRLWSRLLDLSPFTRRTSNTTRASRRCRRVSYRCRRWNRCDWWCRSDLRDDWWCRCDWRNNWRCRNRWLRVELDHRLILPLNLSFRQLAHQRGRLHHPSR